MAIAGALHLAGAQLAGGFYWFDHEIIIPQAMVLSLIYCLPVYHAAGGPSMGAWARRLFC